jgi:hypothetical protein
MQPRRSAAYAALCASLCLLVSFATPACDATGGADDNGSGGGSAGSAGDPTAGGGGGASSAEQDQCKDSCNQLKFFDCNDAADHAACFVACENASSSQIELFVSCVQADICDPECATDLIGAAPPPSGEAGGEGEGEGGGGGGTTCFDACVFFIADGCAPPIDCAVECALLSELEQSFVTYCLDRRDGCSLPEECTDLFGGEVGGESDGGEVGGGEVGGGEVGGGEVGGSGSVEACLDACDEMLFFACIEPAQQAICRDTCETASEQSIGTFLGCAPTCDDDACLTVFLDAQ